MIHFAAVLDANVLYSYPLTSVLLELAEARLYRCGSGADLPPAVPPYVALACLGWESQRGRRAL